MSNPNFTSPEELANLFIKKYGDKAVWQVDTSLRKLARMIELTMEIPTFQGGETQRKLQAELDELKYQVFSSCTRGSMIYTVMHYGDDDTYVAFLGDKDKAEEFIKSHPNKSYQLWAWKMNSTKHTEIKREDKFNVESAKYVTLECLTMGGRFIMPFDPEKDTPESISKRADGSVAFKPLGFHRTIEDAQRAI